MAEFGIMGMGDTSKEILEELRKISTLLMTLIDVTENRKTVGAGGKGSTNNLTPEEQADLEFEIDLEWWFGNYGEEALPAKYMCTSMGIPAPNTNPYSKDENEFIFNRMMDFVEEKNDQGTHVFRYLGKVWCKREGNARNCFAFKPVRKENVL